MNSTTVSELDREISTDSSSNDKPDSSIVSTKLKPQKRLSTDSKPYTVAVKKPSKVAFDGRIKRTSVDRDNLILQKKSIIFNVYSFFKKLAANPRKLNFNQAQLLTAEACGISLTSVKRVTRSYCVVEKLDEGECNERSSREEQPGPVYYKQFVQTVMLDGVEKSKVVGGVLTRDGYDSDTLSTVSCDESSPVRNGERNTVIEGSCGIEDVPCVN